MDTTPELEQARREGYLALFHGAPVGIIIVGLDAKLLKVNERAAAIFGYPSPDVFIAEVGSMLDLWVDPVERGRAAEIMLDTGVLRDFEVAMTRRDGTGIVVSVSANPLRDPEGNTIALQVSGIDVTARVLAEQRLEEAQSQASIAFWSWRFDTREFVHAGQLFEIIGIAPRDPGSTRIKELMPLIHPDDRDTFVMQLQTIGPTPGRRFEIEFRVTPSTDDVRWLLIRGHVDDDGIQVSGSVQDITRQKLVEARLTELNDMKTEFVSVIAHDLGSPLTVATGYLAFLREQWPQLDDARREAMVDKIENSLRQLVDLVGDVSEVSRIDSGITSTEVEVFDLGEVVSSAVEDLRAVGTCSTCSLSVPPSLPKAIGSRESVERVLANLLSNAMKYAPGSPVDVEVRASNGQLRVAVRDGGPGIAPSDQPKLFKKFSRLSPPQNGSRPPGSGLGLYICRSLVESFGGTIRVESAPGAGSTFSFTVPVAGG